MSLYIIIIAITAIFSAFFSASDMVYSTIDKERLKKSNKKSAKIALKLANDYEFSISSILFGNNLVNIFMSSAVTVLAVIITDEHASWNLDTVTTICTIILTVFTIIFCEFLPKAFAKRFNYSLGLAFAYPIAILKTILFPVVWPISQLSRGVTKLFSKRKKEEEKIDEEVLTEMVDTIEEKGELEEGEAELVRSAIDLNDIQAFEIMTPRVDVYAINKDESIEEILKDDEFYIHSRIPVYEETIDNIIGILPIKAILRARLSGQKINDIMSLCYKPLFIPRNHQLLDLLQEFKSSKIHIAVVLDEYGGTEGIVTMEDILEEIVGEIFDEQDVIEEQYIDKGNGEYVVNGAMNLDDFFELIGFDEEFETDYTTVGGFCQEILDRFAKEDDEFTFSHYSVRVLEAEKYTVEKILVKNLTFEEDE